MDAHPSNLREVSCDEPVQIALLGDDDAGKSALAIRYCADVFVPETDRMMEMTYVRTARVKNQSHELYVADYAGGTSWTESCPRRIVAARVIAFVYSIEAAKRPENRFPEGQLIEQRKTFSNIHREMESVTRIAGEMNLPRPAFLLVRAQVDRYADDVRRQIAAECAPMVENIMKDFPVLAKFDVSAKTGEGLTDLFRYLDGYGVAVDGVAPGPLPAESGGGAKKEGGGGACEMHCFVTSMFF